MILVVGATGLLGGTITRQLLDRGKTVRILVRHNSLSEVMAPQGMATLAQSLIDTGAQPVYGDLKDPPSLAAACRGVDTVITTANSALRGGVDNVENVDLKGNQSLIEAAAAAGVRHFIFISVFGASPESPSDFIRAKANAERALRDSGMEYTILQPDVFGEIWLGMVIGGPLRAGQPVTLVADAQHKHSFISLGDVAAFAVAAVDNPAARNQSILLGGPEAISWREVIDRAGRVMGRELPVQYVGIGQPIPLVPEAVYPLMWSFEMYDSIIDMQEPSSTYGVRPTPVDVVAARLFAPPAV